MRHVDGEAAVAACRRRGGGGEELGGSVLQIARRRDGEDEELDGVPQVRAGNSTARKVAREELDGDARDAPRRRRRLRRLPRVGRSMPRSNCSEWKIGWEQKVETCNERATWMTGNHPMGDDRTTRNPEDGTVPSPGRILSFPQHEVVSAWN